MNNEDILRMVKEAVTPPSGHDIPGSTYMLSSVEMMKFAALVQAATAEECAKVCDAQEETWLELGGHLQVSAVETCAQAIRTKFQDQATSSGGANNES